MTPLEAAISAAVAPIQSLRGADDLWRSPYLGGPVHTCVGILATSLIGADSQARYEQELELLPSVFAAQDEQGAFIEYPGGPTTPGGTRICVLALDAFAHRHRAALPATPALEHALDAARQRAHRYLRASGAPSLTFLHVVSTLLQGALARGAARDWIPIPLEAETVAFALDARVLGCLRAELSSFAVQALPAMGVLFESADDRSTLARILAWISRHLGIQRPSSGLQALEQDVRAAQARTGGWLWSVLGTSLNLLSMHALHRRVGDGSVDRGLAFIESLRVRGADGALRQSWCNAELWDTAVACNTLHFAGKDVDAPSRARMIRTFLSEQQADGLWAFGLGAIEGDNDSSSVVLTLLSRWLNSLENSDRAEVSAAIARCTQALLGAQQADGGFGYSPRPHGAPYSFGRRLPFGLETALVDASTADVTGRILTSLAAARKSGALDATVIAEIDAAAVRALAYFEQTQSASGSWIGRWSAGYLSELVFVLLSARAVGVAPTAAWVQRARAFVAGRQNDDGGWGERTAADDDPSLAGIGPSTPVQTAYALIALIATSEEDLSGNAQLERGAGFLISTQSRGSWANGRALYTVAFREDYFDAPLLTQSMTTVALQYYRLALEVGADAATRSLA